MFSNSTVFILYRLQKDILEVNKLEHITIIDTDSPTSVIIQFNNDYYESLGQKPHTFLITISKYYPHTCPQIKCLQDNEENYFHNEYIALNGIISHPNLGENWSALGSLWTVIEILDSVRNACYKTEAYIQQPPYTHESHAIHSPINSISNSSTFYQANQASNPSLDDSMMELTTPHLPHTLHIAETRPVDYTVSYDTNEESTLMVEDTDLMVEVEEEETKQTTDHSLAVSTYVHHHNHY